MGGDWSKVRAFIRVARARANRYLIAAEGAVRKPDSCRSSLAYRRPFSRPDDKIPARSLTRNGLLRTQQNSRRRPCYLPRSAGVELYRGCDFRARQAGKAG